MVIPKDMGLLARSWDLAYSPSQSQHALSSQTHGPIDVCTQSRATLGSGSLTHVVFLLHFPYNLGVSRPPEDPLGGESWEQRGLVRL